MTELSKSKISKHQDGKGNLLCVKCGEFLSPDHFSNGHITNDYRMGKDSRCRSCRTKQSAESRASKHGEDRIARVIKERVLNAKLRSDKKNIEFTITEEYIQDLLVKQEGKCALSGTTMTFILGGGRVHTNISIDRKDTNLGYTKENTQLVCMAVNQMKSDMTEEQLLRFCERILQTTKSQ